MTLRIVRLDPARHDRTGFDCGTPSLNRYLHEHAGQHQRDGIATTHVLIDDTDAARVLGYCSLAAAQVNLASLHPADQKRLPHYPVPAVRVARLAVAVSAQGNGYGRLLLGHAANCSLQLREQLGARLLVVDALDARAAAFYRAYGFHETAESTLTMYLSLGKA